MAILPLTNVEVSIGDYDTRKYSPRRATKRMEYAEGIRKMLLDPMGPEKYAQKKEELQEFYRQENKRKDR
ncbi:hypothetical protein IMSHALPRED_009841 [Imshaugia aleurites]|uniref:Uncharacterized protein n=1 Tax=Imshaugia aleurites TaxID=172621 RepID=A0A8H3IVY6_9LECA|nr:hypothetical protein IMSHALPRED_009841 [Imshaugia aleurites]